jgi:hypothetical protein
MGIIKSLSSQEILVHFPEENKKPLKSINTNGKTFGTK